MSDLQKLRSSQSSAHWQQENVMDDVIFGWPDITIFQTPLVHRLFLRFQIWLHILRYRYVLFSYTRSQIYLDFSTGTCCHVHICIYRIIIYAHILHTHMYSPCTILTLFGKNNIINRSLRKYKNKYYCGRELMNVYHFARNRRAKTLHHL